MDGALTPIKIGFYLLSFKHFVRALGVRTIEILYFR